MRKRCGAARRIWLESRSYRVIDMKVSDIEADLEGALARLEASILRQF